MSAVAVAAAAGSGHREATSGGTTKHRSSSIDDSVSDGAVWMAMPPPAQASAGARSSGSGAACSPIGATALIMIGVRSPMQPGGMSIRIAVPSSATLHDTSSNASFSASFNASFGPPTTTCVTSTAASFSMRILPGSQAAIGRTRTCNDACLP